MSNSEVLPSLQAEQPGPALIDAERREVTVLFADLVASTMIGETVGDEAIYAITKKLFHGLVGIIETRGGRLAEFSGDGLMALFGGPVALDDAPLVACRAALDMRRLAAGQATKVALPVPLELRIGIATGIAVVGEIGLPTKLNLTALGESVNLAARLEQLAEPSEILIDLRTHEVAAAALDAVLLGPRAVKGRKERALVFRLNGIREGITRFRAANLTNAPIIGRDDEIAALNRIHEESRLEPRVVGLWGDPGIGKSRLAVEFTRSVIAAGGRVLTGNCLPDSRNTPYNPIVDILRQVLDLDEAVSDATAESTIRRELSRWGLATSEGIALIKRLLRFSKAEEAEVDSPIMGLRLRDLLFRWLDAERAASFSVFVFEDIHWIDEVSRELIARLATGATRPGLILWTSRGSGPDQWPGDAKIRLGGLAPQAVVQLLRLRLAVESIPDELSRFLMEKSDGNPLYAKAIADLLVDRGDIRPSGNAVAFELGDDAPLPQGSIQNLILQRVDHLSRATKGVLQAGSVCGRSFSQSLLEKVLPHQTAGEIDVSLRSLVEHNLVVATGQQFAFQHSLVRDAVYTSLLGTDREAIHRRIGEELEQEDAAGGRVDSVQLAHHFTRAGVIDKGIVYLTAAGQAALSSYSLAAADRLFRSAMASIENNPSAVDDRRLAFLLAIWMRVLELLGRFSDIRRLAETHLPRLQAAPDTSESISVLTHYAHALAHGHRFDEAKATANKAIDAAVALADEAGAAHARLILIKVLGKTRRGLASKEVAQLGELILETARTLSDGYLELVVLMELANDRMHRGALLSARQALDELVRAGERRRDPRAKAFALWMVGWLDLQEGDYQAALEKAEQSLAATLTATDALVAAMVKGTALALSGRPTEAIPILSQVRTEATAHEDYNVVSAVDSALGVAMALQGRLAFGVRLIKRSIRRGETTGYVTSAAYGRLVLAEIYSAIATRQRRSDFRTVVRNLPFLLLAMPAAPARVRRLVSWVIESGQFEPVSVVSIRCNLALGAVEARRLNSKSRAAMRLGQARTMAEELGTFRLRERVEAALR